jgi:bleomycin hydrolase
MGQAPSKVDEKEAGAGMSRMSLENNAYVFVDDESCR